MAHHLYAFLPCACCWLVAAVLHHQQQFFALAVDRHDVYLAHPWCHVCHSLAPVEHGRQLEHHHLCLLHQQCFQLFHVGSAVVNGKGASALLVAPCWVGKDHGCGGHVVQVIYSVGAHRLDVLGQHHPQVVLHNGSECAVLFHIGGVGKQRSQQGEIHPKASGKVGHGGFFVALAAVLTAVLSAVARQPVVIVLLQPLLHHPYLVACGDLT